MPARCARCRKPASRSTSSAAAASARSPRCWRGRWRLAAVGRRAASGDRRRWRSCIAGDGPSGAAMARALRCSPCWRFRPRCILLGLDRLSDRAAARHGRPRRRRASSSKAFIDVAGVGVLAGGAADLDSAARRRCCRPRRWSSLGVGAWLAWWRSPLHRRIDGQPAVDAARFADRCDAARSSTPPKRCGVC